MNIDKAKLKQGVENVKKYIPETIDPATIQVLLYSRCISMMRANYLQQSYEQAAFEFERYKRKVCSNNWRKMHGLPMRRRV